jgi:hypothetical protein
MDTTIIKEMEARMAWQLNKLLRNKYRQLYIRLGFSEQLDQAHAEQPGDEVAELILRITKRDGMEGFYSFYKLLEELEEKESLKLINDNPVVGAFVNQREQPKNKQHMKVNSTSPVRRNSTNDNVNKFLMVPNDTEELSTALDLILRGLGFELIHNCKDHELWFKEKRGPTHCNRYILKFLVGERSSTSNVIDTFSYASEILFLLFCNEDSNTMNEITDVGDIKSLPHCPDVRFCFQLLVQNLQEEHPNKFFQKFGVPKNRLDKLQNNLTLNTWMTSAKTKTADRIYCCFKFDPVSGRQLQDIGVAVHSTVVQCTGVTETRKEAVAYASINVYLSSCPMLAGLLQLHRSEIYNQLKREGLKLLSIHEVCIQHVMFVQQDTRNEEFREELDSMIEKMKQDEFGSAVNGWKIDSFKSVDDENKLKEDAATKHNETEDRAQLLSDLMDIDLKDIAERCESDKWQRIGLIFEETHHFVINYKQLQAKHLHANDATLRVALFHDLAERGITIAELANALQDRRIGLNSVAEYLRTTSFKKSTLPRKPTQEINEESNKVNRKLNRAQLDDLLEFLNKEDLIAMYEQIYNESAGNGTKGDLSWWIDDHVTTLDELEDVLSAVKLRSLLEYVEAIERKPYDLNKEEAIEWVVYYCMIH